MKRFLTLVGMMFLLNCTAEENLNEANPPPAWADGEEGFVREAIDANCDCSYNGRDPDCSYVYYAASDVCFRTSTSENYWDFEVDYGTLWNRSSSYGMWAECSFLTYSDEGYTPQNYRGFKMYAVDTHASSTLYSRMYMNNMFSTSHTSWGSSCSLSGSSSSVQSCLTSTTTTPSSSYQTMHMIAYIPDTYNYADSAITGFRVCYSI